MIRDDNDDDNDDNYDNDDNDDNDDAGRRGERWWHDKGTCIRHQYLPKWPCPPLLAVGLSFSIFHFNISCWGFQHFNISLFDFNISFYLNISL